MTRIKISANYDTSENLTYRLIKQFVTSNVDLNDIEFVFDNTYDIIIFFNYVTEPVLPGKKGFIFPHEPSWNGSHQKYIPDDVKIFGFSSELYDGCCIESIAHTFYGGRGPWIDKLDFWNYENLISRNFEKKKIISSSITPLNFDYGGSCLYKKRFKLLEELKKRGDIDIFDGSNSPERKDSLVNYMFNISIENSYEKNWITEKFYDNILTDTIPIYYGCKNIKEIYPEDGYILINNIDDLNEIMNILNSILDSPESIYNSKIEGLKQIKKKYFSENNIINKIKKLLVNGR